MYCFLIIELDRESKLLSIGTASPLTINQGIRRRHYLYSEVYYEDGRNTVFFYYTKPKGDLDYDLWLCKNFNKRSGKGRK